MEPSHSKIEEDRAIARLSEKKKPEDDMTGDFIKWGSDGLDGHPDPHGLGAMLEELLSIEEDMDIDEESHPQTHGNGHPKPR